MLSLPVVRAVSMRDCMTLRLELSNFFCPKGSSDKSKSKVGSVGTTGISGASAIVVTAAARDGCLEAARFAAFALAICSRNAEDDFRLVEANPSSAESTVIAVEAVEALDGFRSSPLELTDANEFLRGGRERVGNSGEVHPSVAGLKSPLAEVRDLS